MKKKKLNGFQLKQQKQQKHQNGDVKDYFLKKFGENKIYQMNDNEDFLISKNKNDSRVQFISRVKKRYLQNDTLEIYLKNNYTYNWYKRLFETDDSFKENRTSCELEDDDKKSDFIKEMEEITSGCLNWFEKLGRFSTELINTEIRNYNGELLLSGITMFGTDINKLMKQIN